MKRLTILLLTAGLVLAFAASSLAIDVKNYGYFRIYSSWVPNYDFDDDTSNQGNVISQRARYFFDFIASENLKSTLGIELDQTWGFPGNTGFRKRGADAGADDVGDWEIKRSMLTFVWPDSKVTFKIGVQGVSLPDGALGNPVAASDVAGIVVSAPIDDMLSVVAGMVRPWNTDQIQSDSNGARADAFFLVLPVKMEGISLKPYIAFAVIGQDIANTSLSQQYVTTYNPTAYTDDFTGYWLGLDYALTMIDPLEIKGSIIYGNVNADQDQNDRAGWYADFSAAYKMDDMTPMVWAFYSSGEDDDTTDGSETFPGIFNDGYCSDISSVAVGFRCNFGFSDANYSLAQEVPHGLWEIGIGIKDLSFIDKLTHSFGISYGQGNHDKDAVAQVGANAFMNNGFNEGFTPTEFTTEDSFFQARLDSRYQIYENLAAIFELGYAKLDMDEDVWGDDFRDDPAYLINLGLSYDF